MFFDVIRRRRSTRSFSEQPVGKEKLDKLLESVLRAPTSRGLYPCRFLCVTSREILGKLSLAKQHGSGFLKGAQAAIVVTANPDICDVWIEDASIASIYLHLAAEALDLGSCWIQIRNRQTKEGKSSEEYVKTLLDIPPNFSILSIIAFGYKAEETEPHPDEELKRGHIFFEKFGEQAGKDS